MSEEWERRVAASAYWKGAPPEAPLDWAERSEWLLAHGWSWDGTGCCYCEHHDIEDDFGPQRCFTCKKTATANGVHRWIAPRVEGRKDNGERG